MNKFLIFLCSVLLLCGFSSPASATPVFFGATPYLSSADIPANFYESGSTPVIEDFEDGTLDFGITASYGYVKTTAASLDYPDSVDADDGYIDGSGSTGYSWYFGGGSNGVTFTFSSPVTAAGMVWTDGWGTTTFEAFGAGMISLGTFGPVAIADGSRDGGTAEDRFFGVQDLDGLLAIKLSNTSSGIEIDHLQFGEAFGSIESFGSIEPFGSGESQSIPEPATMLLLGSGLFALVGFSRKKFKQ